MRIARIASTLPTVLFALVVAACSSAPLTRASNTEPPHADDTSGDDDGTDDSASSPDAGTKPKSQPSSARCAVTQKGTSGIVVRATLLTPQGASAGELFIDGSGKIACVDASCASSKGYDDASVVDCPDGVASPGLINGHDHTEYATRGPETHGTTRWQHRNGWRTGAEGEPRLPKVPSTTDAAKLAAAELRFLMGGATSVNGSGGVRGLLRNLAARNATSQLEGLTSHAVYFDTFPLGDSKGTEISSGCSYPSIRSPSSAFLGGAYSPHIAEGINAAAQNELSCLAGSLVKSNTAIIHAVGIGAEEAKLIADKGAKVIWSARTNVDLYGNTAPVTLLKHLGVTMGLGTDWLASGSMNMLRELACVDSLNDKYFDHAFSDRELVELATSGSAHALGVDRELGSIEPGKLGDVALFARGESQSEYRAVLEAGVEDVMLVMRGGKVLYGDSAIVDALQTGCDELALCGTQKRICVDAPNLTLAAIQSAAAATYPLFFCKDQTPKDEPSCVPYRDSYPNGSSASDRDGDGVDDASDSCPSVFNPPRPLDGTAQADADGDGAGDACDAQPLDASSH